jgi:hypothetical protein
MAKEKRLGKSGGFDDSPINTFYQMKEPETPHEKVKVLQKGQELIGRYSHTFVDGDYRTHLFTSKSEGKFTVKGCASLNNAIAEANKGDTLRIVYSGKGAKPAKPGRKAPFLFEVFLTTEELDEAPTQATTSKTTTAKTNKTNTKIIAEQQPDNEDSEDSPW